jgi:hypothetical protein
MIGAMDLSRVPALRPQSSPTTTQPTRDVSAAQRAFFQAALGKVTETAAAEPEPQPTLQAAAETMSQAAEQPRLPRPGSIIDIRV